MLRRLHSIAGLALALMLLVITATGVLLAFEPAANRLAYPGVARGTSVAVLADARGGKARARRLDPRAWRRRRDGDLQRWGGKEGRGRRSANRRGARRLRDLRILPLRRRPASLAADGRCGTRRRRDRSARDARALRHRHGAACAQPRRRVSVAAAHSRRRRAPLARRARPARLGRLAAVVADRVVSRRHDLWNPPDSGGRVAGRRRERRPGRANPQASRRSPKRTSPTSSN